MKLHLSGRVFIWLLQQAMAEPQVQNEPRYSLPVSLGKHCSLRQHVSLSEMCHTVMTQWLAHLLQSSA